MHGQSRSGKSTFCNKILNEYEALESSASESVTYVINEYANEYIHLFDTPVITITKNKKLGDTSKTIINYLTKVFKRLMILKMNILSKLLMIKIIQLK